MSVNKLLKRKLAKVKADMRWLNISLRKQAEHLGISHVTLDKIYDCTNYDETIINKLVAYRDAEMQKAKQTAESITL